MTLKDISSGPDWTMWATAAVLVVISIVLLTGRGAFLIAGYNTASKEEKSKYDAKKMSRIAGAGMSVITLFVLIMAIWEDVLPSYISYIFGAVVLIVCIAVIILSNTICKKTH